MEIVGVGRLERIAEFVKAFLVEGISGQFRLAPIARRDIRTLGADFQLAVVRHQLGLVARHRKPDMAGAAGGGIDRHKERRGLGGPEPGQDRHARAGLPHRKFIKAIPDIGR